MQYSAGRLLSFAVFVASIVAIRVAKAEDPRVKTIEHFTCSGTIGTYFAGIADRSIGSGDSMCYFISQSDVGRKILRTCGIGKKCRVTATVKNDQTAGDWSPIIVDVVNLRK